MSSWEAFRGLVLPTLRTKTSLDPTELAIARRKGCKEGLQERTAVTSGPEPFLQRLCVVPRKTELHLPESSSAPRRPTPRSPLAPPLLGLLYKGRMARPGTERGGGAAHRAPSEPARCGRRSWPRRSARLHPEASFAPRASTLSSLGPADLQTRGGERICLWLFPDSAEGFRRESGLALAMRSQGGRGAASMRGAPLERGGGVPSAPARTVRPPPPRTGERGPCEPQPGTSARPPRVRAQRPAGSSSTLDGKWAVGWVLRAPNVDYLVCTSRAQKTRDPVSGRGLIHST